MGGRARDEERTELERDECALRCMCGSLLARLVPGGVELKCRRCKTTRILPLHPSTDGTGS